MQVAVPAKPLFSPSPSTPGRNHGNHGNQYHSLLFSHGDKSRICLLFCFNGNSDAAVNKHLLYDGPGTVSIHLLRTVLK